MLGDPLSGLECHPRGEAVLTVTSFMPQILKFKHWTGALPLLQSDRQVTPFKEQLPHPTAWEYLRNGF